MSPKAKGADETVTVGKLVGVLEKVVGENMKTAFSYVDRETEALADRIGAEEERGRVARDELRRRMDDVERSFRLSQEFDEVVDALERVESQLGGQHVVAKGDGPDGSEPGRIEIAEPFGKPGFDEVVDAIEQHRETARVEAREGRMELVDRALDAARPEYDTSAWTDDAWEDFKASVRAALRSQQ